MSGQRNRLEGTPLEAVSDEGVVAHSRSEAGQTDLLGGVGGLECTGAFVVTVPQALVGEVVLEAAHVDAAHRLGAAKGPQSEGDEHRTGVVVDVWVLRVLVRNGVRDAARFLVVADGEVQERDLRKAHVGELVPGEHEAPILTPGETQVVSEDGVFNPIGPFRQALDAGVVSESHRGKVGVRLLEVEVAIAIEGYCGFPAEGPLHFVEALLRGHVDGRTEPPNADLALLVAFLVIVLGYVESREELQTLGEVDAPVVVRGGNGQAFARAVLEVGHLRLGGEGALFVGCLLVLLQQGQLTLQSGDPGVDVGLYGRCRKRHCPNQKQGTRDAKRPPQVFFHGFLLLTESMPTLRWRLASDKNPA